MYTASAVVSGTHVLTTAAALPDEHVPAVARQVRVGNGFGMVLRLALSEKVKYRNHTEPDSRVGLGLLIKNRAATHEALTGIIWPENPPPTRR